MLEPGTRSISLKSSAISGADSNVIHVARVICITFMISAHLPPGEETISVINNGNYSFISAIWIDILGRASVPTLSFISGYLLFDKLVNNDKSKIIITKLKNIIVPMLTWNLIFISAMIVFTPLALPENDIVFNLFEGSHTTIFSSITGISGSPANYSLWFLRDLFVSFALIVLFWPLLSRLLLPAVVIITVACFSYDMGPIIFRSNILLFVLYGCVARHGNLTLSRISKPSISFNVALITLISTLAMSHWGLQFDLQNDPKNFILRAGLIPITLWVSSALAQTPLIEQFRLISATIFIAYLSHLITARAFWGIWKYFGGSAMAPSYVVFFITMPFIAILASIVLKYFVDRLPKPFRIMLAGRA